MQINRIVQVLLFALVIIGIFASMAKNAYGFTLMGIACFGLATLYLVQLIWKLIEDYSTLTKNEKLSLAELFFLAIMLTLFGLRAFYIYLPGSKLMFMVVCIFLIIIYLMNALDVFNATRRESRGLTFNMGFFYLSIFFFLASMFIRVVPLWSIVFGIIGLLLTLPFLFSMLRKQQFEIQGGTVTLFNFVRKSKSKAGLLFIFFISSGVYTGLSQIELIPQIENSDRPKAYIELINNAESGKEKSVDGKYRHEAYKKAMDKFLERHGK